MGFEAHEPAGDDCRDPESKGRHLDVCLSGPVGYRKSTGLECYDLLNQALPELCLDEIDLSVSLAGRILRAPLMIAPMTGGDARTHELNRILVAAAQRWGLPMGVGSQRVAIEDPSRARYFQLREEAPDAVLFANIGGAQLVKGWGGAEARRAVEMIRADALFVHLNPMQEAVQGGDLDFRGLAGRLARLCEELAADGVPVFAREVCFGLSEGAARELLACGVAGVDCAGAGGTSWARVEALCTDGEGERHLGQVFGEWGIPTAESIVNVRRVAPDLPLIACGGLRTGLDLAKALALGADVAAMARPFLIKAAQGPEALDAFIAQVLRELRAAMFASGAGDVSALRGTLTPR